MFRFTIRELVLVTVIVACLVAWRLDHRQAAIARDRDSEHYIQQWNHREQEWIEANRWWKDQKNAWLRQRHMKES